MSTKKTTDQSASSPAATESRAADDVSPVTSTAVILDGRHVRRLSKEVVASLKRYSPKFPDKDWATIRDFVLDAAAATAEGTSLDLDRAVKIAAPFVQWAVSLQGLPLEAGAVFNRRVIDAYCESLALAEGSVSTYRSVLLRLADNVAPTENPLPMRPISRRSIRDPYTRAEVEAFRTWANGQRTEARTRKAKLLLAGCAGAGLRPAELGTLHPEDVVASESGVTISVRGSSPREVTVLAEWEDMFLEAVAGSEPGRPVWGPDRSAPKNKNLVTDFTDRCDGTAPNSTRLRASWIVRLLDARVHITVIFKAGGFKQFHNLHQYLAYLTSPSVQDARAQLRGKAQS